MKKLDVGAILMKRFRAWGSHEYEVRHKEPIVGSTRGKIPKFPLCFSLLK